MSRRARGSIARGGRSQLEQATVRARISGRRGLDRAGCSLGFRTCSTEDWLPHPRNDEIKDFHVVHRAIRMLEIATPDARAARRPLAAPRPDAGRAGGARGRDPLDRAGEAVEIVSPVGAVFTVVFDPDAAELLFWELRKTGAAAAGETHIVVRAGHVAETDERP